MRSIPGNELSGLGAFTRGLIFVHALNCGSKDQEGAAHQEQLVTGQGTTPLGTCWVLGQAVMLTAAAVPPPAADVVLPRAARGIYCCPQVCL